MDGKGRGRGRGRGLLNKTPFDNVPSIVNRRKLSGSIFAKSIASIHNDEKRKKDHPDISILHKLGKESNYCNENNDVEIDSNPLKVIGKQAETKDMNKRHVILSERPWDKNKVWDASEKRWTSYHSVLRNQVHNYDNNNNGLSDNVDKKSNNNFWPKREKENKDKREVVCNDREWDQNKYWDEIEQMWKSGGKRNVSSGSRLEMQSKASEMDQVSKYLQRISLEENIYS